MLPGLYGALNIGGTRDTAENALEQAVHVWSRFPSGWVGGEKPRRTALNERGSWRLC